MNKIGYTAFSEKVYKIMPALKLSVFSCFVSNQQTLDRDTGKINRCRIAFHIMQSSGIVNAFL